MQVNPGTILHLAQRADWNAVGSSDEYRCATLDSEGFIHCSTAQQLPGVAARYYAARNDLVLLEIDPGSLPDRVVWEDSTGSGQSFPHVYGPVPVAAIVNHTPVIIDADGGIHT